MRFHHLHLGWAALLFVLACGSETPADDGGTDASAPDSGSGPDATASDAAADTTQPPPTDGATETAPPPTDGGFDPLSIPGLAIWLRADHVTTDTSGNVAVWPDLSPNHDDFTPTGGHPAVMASAINGKPAVDMTIINTVTGHATTVGTGPVLVEIVVNGVQKNGTAFYGLAANNNSLVIGTSSNGSARAWEAAANPVATASSGTVITNNTWHILGAQVDGSSNISIRINGALAGGPTGGANLDLGKLDATNIGGNAVAELVVVVGAISGANLASLEAYLKARYAL